MLIGSISYYRYPSGVRLHSFDTKVPVSAESSTEDIVAIWSCENGDPFDVRYFLDHRPLSRAQADAFDLVIAARR